MASQDSDQSDVVQPEPADEPLRREIAQLRTQCEEAQDRALRCQAELDNYRKRVNRQLEEDRRYASLPVIRDMLPVLDNVNRAIDAAEKNADGAKLLEGFKMVARQLEAVFDRHHCTPIEALHQPFDPHLHEAICQQPSDAFSPNTVLQVVQGGFCMHDRVVRPSHVIVAAAGEAAAASDDNDGQATERE